MNNISDIEKRRERNRKILEREGKITTRTKVSTKPTDHEKLEKLITKYLELAKMYAELKSDLTETRQALNKLIRLLKPMLPKSQD